jgi:hypothetical protein
MTCERCNDTGWVCENHPDKEAHECCGGAGMPCTCNDAKPPWNYVAPKIIEKRG